jgi:transposase
MLSVIVTSRPFSLSEVSTQSGHAHVVAAVRDERLSHRAAAARFKVSAASISRWRALERQSGDLRPGPLGGDRRSAVIEVHARLILRLFKARCDMSIEELRAQLAGRGLHFGYGTLWRFFARHNLTRKKRPRTPPSRIVLTS